MDIDTVLGYDDAPAAGTGMVLTPAGVILTNNHVVEGSTRMTVTVAATGQTYPAAVVGTDAVLAPSHRPDESTVDEGRQPLQRSRSKIFDILVQGRYPVVIDQGGLKRIGRVLDSEQGPGQLRIGAGRYLKNAHVLSLTGRESSQMLVSQ